MHNDLSLNLSGSQNESAIRQLKTLTSPLSKLATGMKSFGMNLDPRKMNLKVKVRKQSGARVTFCFYFFTIVADWQQQCPTEQR